MGQPSPAQPAFASLVVSWSGAGFGVAHEKEPDGYRNASIAEMATRGYGDRDEALCAAGSLSRRKPEGVGCTLRLMVKLSLSGAKLLADPGLLARAPTPGMLRWVLRRRTVPEVHQVSIGSGALLKIISAGEQRWVHSGVKLWQLAKHFVLPYCRSTYSAARNKAQHGRGD
jgi:hypothetical protein